MRLVFDPTELEFDLALTAQGGLDSGVGNGGVLETAIWTSLFSDGVASADELTPDLGTDRRGWWNDSGLPDDHHLARSLLWLYRRAKKNETTRLAIQNTCIDCLQWLVDDAIVSAIDVAVAWLPSPLEGVQITVTSSEPPAVVRDWQADLVWSGIAS